MEDWSQITTKVYHFFRPKAISERTVVHIRNPNGYGSVVRLSGNRRKPFWVRKTVGWNDKGYPIYETIGYCVTREEGNILLAEYNKTPWDVDNAKITLQELFDLWWDRKASKLGQANRKSLKTAYKHIKKLSDMKYREIRSFHMQDSIDFCGKGYSSQGAIKTLWGHLDRFALELDVITRMYSNLLTSEPIPQTTRERFSDAEINKIWNVYHEAQKGKDFGNVPVEWIDTVLLFLYTGFRFTELLTLKTKDIDLDAGTFKGGLKTRAGKDRIVPIHSAILPIVLNRLNPDFEYLINVNGQKIADGKYRTYWHGLMDYLKINKTPHECRHTFESILDSKGANRRCIDLLMGHVSKDVGNRVYNHKTLEELKTAIELFKVN